MNLMADTLSHRDEEVVLEISERMRRRKECGKPLLIYLKKDIENDMQKYCRGNKASILKYLVRLGLDSLVQQETKKTK